MLEGELDMRCPRWQNPQKLLWIGMGLLFLVPNLPMNRVRIAIAAITKRPEFARSVIDPDAGIIPPVSADQIVKFIVEPIKAISFLVAVVYLAMPAYVAVRQLYDQLGTGFIKRCALISVFIFVCVSLLIFPYAPPWGPQSMGLSYGLISYDPFMMEAGIYYRRLLKPAIAHYLLMDGPVFYWVFSIACLFVLIFLIVFAIEAHRLKIRRFAFLPLIDNAPNPTSMVAALLCLSFATSSCVMYDALYPGYPDDLLFIIILLLFILQLGERGSLGLIALAMVTHDAAPFLVGPFIIMSPNSWKIKLKQIGAIMLFLFFSLASNGFSLHHTLANRASDQQGRSTLMLVVNNLGSPLLGCAISFKLLWLFVPAAAFYAIKSKAWDVLGGILIFCLVPLSTIVIALDTSRLAGFAFVGILASVIYVLSRTYNPLIKATFVGILALNLLIPSGYHGINQGGVYFGRGIYSFLANTLARKVLRI